MRTEDLIESVRYRNQQLRRKIAELSCRDRVVFFRSEDVTAKEAAALRHEVRENVTIIARLRDRLKQGRFGETALTRRAEQNAGQNTGPQDGSHGVPRYETPSTSSRSAQSPSE